MKDATGKVVARGAQKGLWRAVLLSAVILLAAGCTVPEHMEVRAGVDPRNVDDDVRFRTTYYFRVFDLCESLSGDRKKDRIIPQTDSLYRFRMTGKAFALFTNVHFEAGTLKSYEIDPFGANVVFDKKSNRFRFKSRRQTEQEAGREDAQQELQRLMTIYEKQKDILPQPIVNKILDAIGLQLDLLAGKTLTGQPLLVPYTAENKRGDIKILAKQYKDTTTAEDKKNKTDTVKRALAQLEQALAQLEKAVLWEVAVKRASKGEDSARGEWDDQIRLLGGLRDANPIKGLAHVKTLVNKTIGRLKASKSTSATVDMAAPRAIGNGGRDRSPICDSGQAGRRGFQILGPEGWRTFDQDERLILAMSSSGEPLISTLRELSSRVLAEQPDRAALLLPLVKERLRISRTLRTIEGLESDAAKKAAAEKKEAAKKAALDILKVFKEEN
ncbi:MAG: hypothetical protein O7D27_03870 [Alphaproteobacteria bacterium]|nr:hypothetical protein [Alphaproteobacteria bacterium]MCZ6608937.1 hypothetical protein [Alphaproteobacteria bacterium]MCZ6741284.1 hypothetical protein [Alphaproteobacteria bacterium]MCZ6814583.1 hypothetical protein [Alphaproteobacteria bacterium]